MSDFYSDIKLFCVVNTPKVKPFWNEKAVSLGKFGNMTVDKLVNNLNVSIDHDPSFSPRIQYNTLQLPPKTFYDTSTGYYHSILHELGHKLSASLWQTRKLANKIDKFIVMTGEPPQKLKSKDGKEL
jgi:hypothetical protein